MEPQAITNSPPFSPSLVFPTAVRAGWLQSSGRVRRTVCMYVSYPGSVSISRGLWARCGLIICVGQGISSSQPRLVLALVVSARPADLESSGHKDERALGRSPPLKTVSLREKRNRVLFHRSETTCGYSVPYRRRKNTFCERLVKGKEF
ncbi:hypothetical protein RRG08_029587 [Elysia crispata]|uniref:Uncharacterized protein n=1 Tax=Elysia crispata TaxID=231223 RepID=A0AAE0XP81_9GAST|nr:hypothetical protein RRG08_029587 [Elysia crispata]